MIEWKRHQWNRWNEALLMVTMVTGVTTALVCRTWMRYVHQEPSDGSVQQTEFQLEINDLMDPAEVEWDQNLLPGEQVDLQFSLTNHSEYSAECMMMVINEGELPLLFDVEERLTEQEFFPLCVLEAGETSEPCTLRVQWDPNQRDPSYMNAVSRVKVRIKAIQANA